MQQSLGSPSKKQSQPMQTPDPSQNEKLKVETNGDFKSSKRLMFEHSAIPGDEQPQRKIKKVNTPFIASAQTATALFSLSDHNNFSKNTNLPTLANTSNFRTSYQEINVNQIQNFNPQPILNQDLQQNFQDGSPQQRQMRRKVFRQISALQQQKHQDQSIQDIRKFIQSRLPKQEQFRSGSSQQDLIQQ